MATEAGELIVKISADVADIKAALQKTSESVQGLGAKTVAAGNIMSDAFKRAALATVEFVKDSILAFAQHEQAMTRLSLAIGKEGATALDEYAHSLQQTTAFSEEEILSLENQLIQYGIYTGSVKTATEALLDFSARTGKDLPEAGQMLARSMVGQSRELKNYGIDVSVTATRTQNLATVTKALEERMGGAASAMKDTMMGTIDSLNNRFTELKKRMGEDLAPSFKILLNIADKVMTEFEALASNGRTYNDTLEDQKRLLADLTTKAKAEMDSTHQVSKALQQQIFLVGDHVKALTKLKAAKIDDVGATNRELAAVKALQDEIIKLRDDQVELTKITNLETQKRLLTAQSSWEANASFSDQFKVKLADDMAQNKASFVNMAQGALQSFSDSTAKIIIEGGRLKNVLVSLWKNIAEQIISQIIRMITEWLIWEAMTGGVGGFGGGFLGRGAGGGMINEPSMIIGLRSGSSILAGEAGPESFGPPSKMNSLNSGSGNVPGGGGGGGGSGGDVHVHITGQFIEGSPAKWQRLIQEQIAPELRRIAMKDPNSLITRKRGSLS